MTTFAASMLLLRELVAAAQFLAEVPANEQGYPDDTVCVLGVHTINLSNAADHKLAGRI